MAPGMISHRSLIFRLAIVVVAACSMLAALAHAAPSAPAATTTATTNAAPPELTIPLSVFDVTNGPVKDPFFPLSTRSAVPIATNAVAPAFSATSFRLKGLSGGANERLALINNRTLAVGEEAEVTTPSGNVKIRCLQIRDSSAVIRVENQTENIELRFDDHSHSF